MNYQFKREDVDFYSEGTRCSAWFYLPETDEKCPIIVMAHGLGGTREMRLYEYAERFAQNGYACFLFDYRNYGASDGNKRQLINVKMQLKDWNNAIDFIKNDSRIDADKLLLFGSSFSGGHVTYLSAHRNDVKGAVAQCPYTDTMATIKEVGLLYILKRAPFVIADVLSCVTGYHPVMLKLSTYKGELAFMDADEKTTNDFLDGAPGKYFSKINTPIFVAACTQDDLAPADKTIELAKKCKTSTYKTYDCGHFQIYCNELFEEVINDYLEFYNKIFV